MSKEVVDVPGRIMWGQLSVLLSATFATELGSGLMKGFFPLWADEHALKSGLGVILSVFGASYLATTMNAPWLFECVRPVSAMWVALMLASPVQLAFGLSPSWAVASTLVVLCSGLRVVLGAAAGVIDTAVLTVALVITPTSHTARATAWIEAARATGLAAGPAIGATLYELTGFVGPFVLVSVLLLAVAVVLPCVSSSFGIFRAPWLCTPAMNDDNKHTTACGPTGESAMGGVADSAGGDPSGTPTKVKTQNDATRKSREGDLSALPVGVTAELHHVERVSAQPSRRLLFRRDTVVACAAHVAASCPSAAAFNTCENLLVLKYGVNESAGGGLLTMVLCFYIAANVLLPATLTSLAGTPVAMASKRG